MPRPRRAARARHGQATRLQWAFCMGEPLTVAEDGELAAAEFFAPLAGELTLRAAWAVVRPDAEDSEFDRHWEALQARHDAHIESLRGRYECNGCHCLSTAPAHFCVDCRAKIRRYQAAHPETVGLSYAEFHARAEWQSS